MLLKDSPHTRKLLFCHTLKIIFRLYKEILKISNTNNAIEKGVDYMNRQIIPCKFTYFLDKFTLAGNSS